MGISTRLRLGLVAAAVAALLGAVGPAAAQGTGTIRGRVIDAATQRPLSGAQVVVVGGTRRSVTDASGEYVLADVPAGALTIRASLLGYAAESQQVTVAPGESATADFGLRTQSIALDALVVTGTPGATERRALGNAVTTVDAGAITEVSPTSSVSQLLQGRAPGVTILPGSGTAGTASAIRIRGVGSLSAGNNPVFYIDGVRVNTDFYNIGVGGQQLNVLDGLDPDEIESIEVIKGPAAATLYGADAASGVIQIITKKGQVGSQDVQFTAKAEYGQSDWNTEIPTNYVNCDVFFAPGAIPGCVQGGPGTILSDEPLSDALRDGEMVSYSLSARGGGDRYSFYLSGDVSNEDGIFENNFSDRTSFRGNFFVSPSDLFDIALNANLSRNDTRLPLNDNASNGWVRNAFRGYPTYGPFAAGWRGLGPDEINIFDNQTRTDRAIVSLTANYQPFRFFRNRITAGMDVSSIRNSEVYPRDLSGRQPYGATAARGYIFQWRPENRDYTLDYAGTLTADVNADVSSDFSFGAQYLTRQYKSISAEGIGIDSRLSSLISNAEETFGYESFSEFKSLGLYVQERVGWRNRLFVTGALRFDDNSTFGEDFDWIVFPKASVSWVVSEEPFFNLPNVDELKLRASWGRAGNSPGAFEADQTYAIATVVDENGNTRSSFRTDEAGNPDLKAETGSEIELGFDASLLNDRLGLDFTYYSQHTNDALLSVPVPPSSGFTGSTLQNVGELKNSGFELGVNATPVQTESFTWDARVAASTNDNEFVSFGGTRTNDDPILYGYADAGQQVREGYVVAGYWAYPFVRDGNGDIVFNEFDEPEVADEEVFIGPPAPTREASLTNTFTLFRNFQVYSFLDYKGGHYLYNMTQQTRDNDANSWEVNNPDADPEDVLIRGYYSDVPYIEKADFVKLREVAVTYNVPSSLSRRFGTDGLSFTLAGRNLKTWTDYSGVDPEVNIQGPANFTRGEYMSVPPLRHFVATVNVRF